MQRRSFIKSARLAGLLITNTPRGVVCSLISTGGNTGRSGFDGINLGILWLKPLRVNVTDTIKSGNNELIVNVTNLWPNMLIGDEQFPEQNKYDDKNFEGQDGY